MMRFLNSSTPTLVVRSRSANLTVLASETTSIGAPCAQAGAALLRSTLGATTVSEPAVGWAGGAAAVADPCAKAKEVGIVSPPATAANIAIRPGFRPKRRGSGCMSRPLVQCHRDARREERLPAGGSR